MSVRNLRWYVLNTNPKAEDLVEKQLQLRGLETYLPKIERQQARGKKKTQPLFPGYIFVKLDLNSSFSGNIKYMHGSRKFLCLNGKPVPVSESLINTIKLRLKQNYAKAVFKKGDKVKFVQGVFKGLEGIFTGEVSGKDRVKILVTVILNSYVEAPLAQIAKAG